MKKKDDKIVFEETTMRNQSMIDLLEKTMNFNNDLIKIFQNKKDEYTKILNSIKEKNG
tara:strand:+ start:271 stop:444 length:174 start_codon:yes stop_codon:yes gene_type:complete